MSKVDRLTFALDHKKIREALFAQMEEDSLAALGQSSKALNDMLLKWLVSDVGVRHVLGVPRQVKKGVLIFFGHPVVAAAPINHFRKLASLLKKLTALLAVEDKLHLAGKLVGQLRVAMAIKANNNQVAHSGPRVIITSAT